jgi:hypothetical protein
VTRRLLAIAALVATVAFVGPASVSAGNGNQPDVQGMGGGYLPQCLKYTELKEWNCYLDGMKRVVLASKNPATLLPDLDVLSRNTGGYLAASCHMMMHVIGRDYAIAHHVTLETLQQYLPRSNDPGCSAGFGMGLVMGLSSAITLGGPNGANAICSKAPTRFRNYSCYHALGHAYMRYYHGQLSYSLKSCNALGAQALDCVQGAFHDYWLGLSGQDGAKYTHGLPRTARGLCAQEPTRDAVACWFRYYVTIPPKRTPTSASRIEALCTGLRGQQRFGCIASASVISSSDPNVQFSVCRGLPAGDVVACLHGVGYVDIPPALNSLVSFIGRCGTLPAGTKAACFVWVGTAMGVMTNGSFAKTGCPSLHSPSARDDCVAGVKLMSQPLITFA